MLIANKETRDTHAHKREPKILGTKCDRIFQIWCKKNGISWIYLNQFSENVNDSRFCSFNCGNNKIKTKAARFFSPVIHWNVWFNCFQTAAASVLYFEFELMNNMFDSCEKIE